MITRNATRWGILSPSVDPSKKIHDYTHGSLHMTTWWINFHVHIFCSTQAWANTIQLWSTDISNVGPGTLATHWLWLATSSIGHQKGCILIPFRMSGTSANMPYKRIPCYNLQTNKKNKKQITTQSLKQKL